MKILTSKDDDFLYDKLILLLQEVKLVQGGNALASTLRRHDKIKSYMIEKQRVILSEIEDYYFDGSGLNTNAIQNHILKQTSLQR